MGNLDLPRSHPEDPQIPAVPSHRRQIADFAQIQVQTLSVEKLRQLDLFPVSRLARVVLDRRIGVLRPVNQAFQHDRTRTGWLGSEFHGPRAVNNKGDWFSNLLPGFRVRIACGRGICPVFRHSERSTPAVCRGPLILARLPNQRVDVSLEGTSQFDGCEGRRTGLGTWHRLGQVRDLGCIQRSGKLPERPQDAAERLAAARRRRAWMNGPRTAQPLVNQGSVQVQAGLAIAVDHGHVSPIGQFGSVHQYGSEIRRAVFKDADTVAPDR